jgi:CheY-like chemotaxis protein
VCPPDPSQSSLQIPARLLVAEDHTMLRSLFATALEREGYETLQAADGEEALRLATRDLHSLDLLLTDDRMPGMNGWELTRVLKALRPDLKVIVMSAHGSEDLLAPGVVMLLKPFTLNTLRSLVASQLDGAEGSEGADST